ncbi:MAG: hypothetical protein JNK41_03795 [Saprospiraceae bacterium]|nr:hypothetical protein [Saprospiraceae bacterium]
MKEGSIEKSELISYSQRPVVYSYFFNKHINPESMNIFTQGLNHSGSNLIKNFNSYPKVRLAILTIFMMVGMLS